MTSKQMIVFLMVPGMFLSLWAEPGKKTDAESIHFSRYAGMYSSPEGAGLVEILEKDNELWAKTPEKLEKLTPEGRHQFSSTESEGEVDLRFKLNEKGVVFAVAITFQRGEQQRQIELSRRRALDAAYLDRFIGEYLSPEGEVYLTLSREEEKLMVKSAQGTEELIPKSSGEVYVLSGIHEGKFLMEGETVTGLAFYTNGQKRFILPKK